MAGLTEEEILALPINPTPGMRDGKPVRGMAHPRTRGEIMFAEDGEGGLWQWGEDEVGRYRYRVTAFG